MLIALGCGRAHFVASSTAPTQTSVVAAKPVSLEPAWIARVHARGTYHRPPFELGDGRVAIFLGSAESAHVLWIVSPTAEHSTELPRAVRVVETKVEQARLQITVETVAALDQPAGLRGVLTLNTKTLHDEYVGPAAPPDPKPVVPKKAVVIPTSDSHAIEPALLRRGLAGQYLGAAPYEDGVIGVALIDDMPNVVIETPRWSAIFQAAMFRPADSGKLAVRFADVDGDGRADVVLQQSGEEPMRGALLSPRSLLDAPTFDEASALSLFRAADLDDLNKVLESSPTGPITKAEACSVVTKVKSAAAFNSVATSDAVILSFHEPHQPTRSPVLQPAAKVSFTGLAVPSHCDTLVCRSTRAYCAAEDGPGSEHYWFRRVDGKLRIAGIAFYTGT